MKPECGRPFPERILHWKKVRKKFDPDFQETVVTRAIGYITPKDMLAGHQQAIQAERNRKLEAARQQRKNRRPRAT